MSKGLIDFVGRRFGRLVVLSRAENSGKRTMWLCQCDCGVKVTIWAGRLPDGKTRSCGCLMRETTTARNLKHGNSVRGNRSPEYKIWLHMLWRCNTPTCPGYPDYGGRGIKVCDRWRDFANFLADMGPRPKGKSIDRWPDNNGNYEPENCRWATIQEQAANRRKAKRLPYRDQMKGKFISDVEYIQRLGNLVE